MAGVFADDATPAQKRAAALDRLMLMCPDPYRMVMRPFVADALANAPDAEISRLMGDVDRIESMIRNGQFDTVVETVKSYGATDSQIGAFLGPYLAAAKANNGGSAAA